MADEQNQSEQGKEAKKVLANFDETVKKLTAIVKGPENLKLPTKVKKDNMQLLVEELFKEESEATIKDVKEGLKALIKGHVALNASLVEERRKLDALEVVKKKEFNATASRLFAKIDGIDLINKEYHHALGAAQAAVENPEPEE
jgi:hypothetical protein